MKALLIDDHALFRDALGLLISHRFPSMDLVACGRLADALERVAQDPAIRLALLDLGLPDSQGLASLAQLREAAPDLTVVVLSGDDRPETILDVIEAGAAGFIPKTAQASVLAEALRVVIDGGVWLPEGALAGADAARAPVAPNPLADLSPRQVDVLRLLIRGQSNKLICRELGLSESTVKTHLAAIFRRLGVHNRTQAVLAAARLGLRLPAPH